MGTPWIHASHSDTINYDGDARGIASNLLVLLFFVSISSIVDVYYDLFVNLGHIGSALRSSSRKVRKTLFFEASLPSVIFCVGGSQINRTT